MNIISKEQEKKYCVDGSLLAHTRAWETGDERKGRKKRSTTNLKTDCTRQVYGGKRERERTNGVGTNFVELKRQS